jgi:hypothetical protein
MFSPFLCSDHAAGASAKYGAISWLAGIVATPGAARNTQPHAIAEPHCWTKLSPLSFAPTLDHDPIRLNRIMV